jgi:hypothetical protein
VPPAAVTGRRWLIAAALLGGVLFTIGLLVEARCAVGRCPRPGVRRLFDLDALGSLPRLFTTAVFVAVGVSALLACRRSAGRRRWWWGALAVVGVGLVVAKAVSVHSSLERDDGRLTTLVVGVVLTVVGLPVLWRAGVRWGVPGALPVTAALAAYAVAALALDQVTAVVSSVTSSYVAEAFAVYLEEGGEAVTALVLLAVVVQAVPAGGGVSRGRRATR